jgi:PAS domain S-box-containing protein
VGGKENKKTALEPCDAAPENGEGHARLSGDRSGGLPVAAGAGKPERRTLSATQVTVLAGIALGAQVALFPILAASNGPAALLVLVALGFTTAATYHWHRLTSTLEPEETKPASETAVMDSLDQKIEQLQDAQWALSDNAERYRTLLDEHTDMIVCRDMNGCVTFTNRAFQRKFNLAPEATLGQPLTLKVIEEKDQAEADTLSAAHDQRRLQKLETVDGGRWIDWVEHRIPGARGTDDATQMTGRDVTESVEARHRLREARDQAEEGNRAKSRFLASMSHEIRTPMNGILGMSSLLMDTTQTEEQKTYTRAIDQSAKNLLTLIDEILDFSKIEAGKLMLKQGHFSLEETIQSVVELMAPTAQQKGLEIAWHLDRNVRVAFVGDALRVRQILLNLVANAVKFTESGGVRISASVVESLDQDGSDVKVRLQVVDTGIGLSRSDQSSLFEEFEQSDDTVRRQVGGTGLGLAISRRLARAMGGDLFVDSQLGQGSAFTVDLRLTLAHRPYPMPSLLPAVRPGLDILLAFNRALERLALSETLRQVGVNVAVCDFDDAMDYVRRSEADGRAFSHIVVEADVDHARAGALLKAAKSAAVTSDASSPPVQGLVLVNVLSRAGLTALRELGYTTYLVRPVRPKSLLEQLNLTPDPSTAPPAAARLEQPATEKPTTAPLRILLAEDNDINALLVERIMDRSGHDLTRVGDGRSAVREMERAANGEGPWFDAVLMDVMLPEMDGFDATKAIKKLQVAASVGRTLPPVIALTANAFEEDRESCLEAGMDDYLAKPFDRAMLEDVLSNWFAADGCQKKPAKIIAAT